MQNQKLKIGIGLALTLLVGFSSGFLAKGLLDGLGQFATAQFSTISSIGSNESVHGVIGRFGTPQALSRRAGGLGGSRFDPFLMATDFPMLDMQWPDLAGSLGTSGIKTIDGAHDVQVTAEVPGMTLRDISIDVGNNMLTIKGHHKEEANNQNNFSSSDQSFVQSVALPCRVDKTKVKSTIANGVLTISLPKLGGTQNFTHENRIYSGTDETAGEI